MSTEAQRKAILETQAARESQLGIKAERLAEAARQERLRRQNPPVRVASYETDMDEKRTAYNLRQKKGATGRKRHPQRN